MEDNRNQQAQGGQVGEQNPTLNDPGAKVTDYGNSTGGSSAVSGEQSGNNQTSQEENTDKPQGNNETIGNP